MIIWWISDSITKPNHVDLGCQGSRNASIEGGNNLTRNPDTQKWQLSQEGQNPTVGSNRMQ
jgi:hypothetical protein